MKDSEIKVGGTYWRLTKYSKATYPKEMTVTEAKEIDGEMRYKAKSSVWTASELYPSFEAAVDGAVASIKAGYQAKMDMELADIEAMRKTGPTKINLQSSATKPGFVLGFDEPMGAMIEDEEEFADEDEEVPY